MPIVLFIASLVAFVVAWETKNFAILGIALALAGSSFAVLVPATRKLFVPVIATILAMTIAEAVLLIWDDHKVSTFRDSDSKELRYYSVEGFGRRLYPGVYGLRRLSTSGEVIFEVTYSIGDDGYRRDLSDGPYDAYIFGGSFAFGHGLNDDETLSAFLFNEHGLNVKNISMDAYGLHQALYNIEENGIASVDGVNILLTTPFHALRSSCKYYHSQGTPRYRVERGVAVLNGVCPGAGFLSKVLKHSKIYSLITRTGIYRDIDGGGRVTDNDIDLYLAIINSIYQETRRNNSELIIAYIDAWESQLKHTTWTNEALISRMKEISDSVIDVTLADTREQLAREFYIHELDTHPTAVANKARAELIADYFRRKASLSVGQ